MTLRRSFRKPRPRSPIEEYKHNAPLPLATRPDDVTDTRELHHRKFHPIRDREYMTWLWPKPCAIEGLTNQRTGIPHVCWSPDDRQRGRQMLSDPAHTGRYGLAMKGDDSGCFPLCRFAHREQEDSFDRFDSDYQINRFEIAARYYAEYREEKERKS